MGLANNLGFLPEYQIEKLFAEFAFPRDTLVDKICPPVFVPHNDSKFTVVDADEYFRSDLHSWAPGADIVVKTVSGAQTTLTTEYFVMGAHAYRYKREQLARAGQNPAMEDFGTIRMLQNQMKAGIARKVFAELIDENNYTNNSTPADWATPSTATPLVDMQTLVNTLTTYLAPNTLIIGKKALSLAKMTAEYLGTFKYVQTITEGGVARLIGDFLGLENVYVVGGQTKAEYGATAVDLMGYNVVICYMDPSIQGNFFLSGDELGFGFFVNGMADNQVRALPVEEITGKNGQTLYSADTWCDPQFINELLAGILYDVNA